MNRYDTALVTGASRGLGAALAEVLLERGLRVLMAARRGDELQARAELLNRQHGGRAQWLAVDLSQPAAVPAFAAEAQARLGGVDVLINNAGTGSYKPLGEWSAQEVTDCVNVNLLAPMLLSQALLPGWMARRRGMVINVASDLARRHLANMAPYVAGKFGLLGFSGSLLREVKSHGIKVTSVLPGIIDTSFNGAVPGSKEETWALRPAALAAQIADLLNLPEHVVIDELTIHPMQQDF